MSDRLEARGEVLKLARLLGVGEAELAFLEELPPAELRQFRERATDRLFDSHTKLLERIAAAARMIPTPLVATIAQRAFGPLLCARAAGAVEPSKAIDVAKRLPPDFLTDTAIELDPRRVAAIIGAVPKELVVPVARELGKRREYVTMGRFLAFVPDHAIVGAMGVLDDEALLRTAFVLEHKDRLDHAIGLLPDGRLPDVLRLATELDLWPEALDLLDQLSDARRGPIADMVAAMDPDVIEAIVAAVAEGDIWDSLLPIVGVMSEPSRERLAALPVFHGEAILDAIVRAAARQGLWVDLVPLAVALPEQARLQLARVAAGLDTELLRAVLRDAAAHPDALPPLLDLVAEMTEAERGIVVEAIDAADESLAHDLAASFGDPALAGPLLARLTDDISMAISRAAERFGLEDTLAAARGDGSA